MAFASLIGRVMFASVFILSAWQEFNDFGIDGWPASKALEPKLNVFSKHEVPEVEIKYLVAAAIALKGEGGLLFIIGSSLGAYLLLLHQAIATLILYDFYNYDADKEEFGQIFSKFTEHGFKSFFVLFLQSLALYGALLFFIGMKNSMPRRQVNKKAPKTKTV